MAMKYWPFFIIAFISNAVGQSKVDVLAKDIVKINNHIISPESAKIASSIEDKIEPEVCESEIDEDEIENKSSLPRHLKTSGWKVLFEVKYVSINEDRSTHKFFNVRNNNETVFKDYYKSRNKKYPESMDEMNSDAADLQKRLDPSQSVELYRNALIFFKMQQSSTANEMYAQYDRYTKDMPTNEKLGVLSTIASSMNYHGGRAEFFSTQDNGAKGKISPFDLIKTGSKGGICGDIHGTMAKLAERSGLEAFTIGYALADGDFSDGGPQHVISAVVDPKDKSKVHIINYGTLQTNDLNSGNSLRLAPTAPDMKGNGIMYRIFKNSGDAETGKMQQIGVLPTSMRGFFDELTKKQYELQKAMPQNENFNQRKTSVVFEHDKVKDKSKSIVHKSMGEGMILYQGTTQEGEIWGVALSHDQYSKVYSKKTGKLKITNTFGANLSGSILDSSSMPGPETYYVYLKVSGAKIFHLIESPQFKFAGAIGAALDGFGAFDKRTNKGLSADANIETFTQVFAEYKKKNTNISMAIKLDTTVGLKDQNLMTDFSSYPKNIYWLKPNAASARVDATQKLNSNTSVTGSAEVVLTNIGNRVTLSTGVVKNNTSMTLNYSGGLGSAGLASNRLKSTNLLQNSLGFDGVKLGLNQNFSAIRRTASGSIGGYVGVSNHGVFNTGATLKINLGRRSRK